MKVILDWVRMEWCRRYLRQLPSADAIAEMASRGEDVSVYFTNKFTVVRSRQTAVQGRALKEERVRKRDSKKKAH